MTDESQIELSFVLLNWNTRELLRDSLSSVLSSCTGRTRVQIIVVDNGSQDGSADMVAADFPDVELVRLESNLGPACGFNVGMRLARGRLVTLVNTDAFLTETTLRASGCHHVAVGYTAPTHCANSSPLRSSRDDLASQRKGSHMTTAIVIGADRGIAAALVDVYRERGCQAIAVCLGDGANWAGADVRIIAHIDVTNAADIGKLATRIEGSQSPPASSEEDLTESPS